MTFSNKVSPRRTICEVHREIYDILAQHLADSEHFDALEDLLQESYTMAKKMDLKLRQYKHGWDDGWWQRQSEAVKTEKLRRRRQR